MGGVCLQFQLRGVVDSANSAFVGNAYCAEACKSEITGFLALAKLFITLRPLRHATRARVRREELAMADSIASILRSFRRPVVSAAESWAPVGAQPAQKLRTGLAQTHQAIRGRIWATEFSTSGNSAGVAPRLVLRVDVGVLWSAFAAAVRSSGGGFYHSLSAAVLGL